MKHKFTLIAALVLALILAMPACAAGSVEYDIPEGGLIVSIPDDLVVFTRDHLMEEDLAAYGLTADGMIEMFDSRNICLNAWDEEINFEILITVADNPIQDFSQFSDSELIDMGDYIREAHESTGVRCGEIELYQVGDLRYLEMDIVQGYDDMPVYGVQYYILMEYKAINFVVNSYGSEVSSTAHSVMRGIVDSARYTGAPTPAEAPADEVYGTAVEVLPPSGGQNGLGGSSSSSAPAEEDEAPASSGGNSLNSIGGGSSAPAATPAPASGGNSLGGALSGGSSGAGREPSSDLDSPYLEGIWDGLGEAGSSSGGGIWGALN